jgi:2-polyprenyl-3-methyl-5-hydroxy-6-metoxy-1,4-benzoquinol methylase
MQTSLTNSSYSSHVSRCRLCGSKAFFDQQLKLKPTALANELYQTHSEAMQADEFALTLVMCAMCKHIQLSEAVTSKRLFDSYVYTSSTSSSFRTHFSELAERIGELLSPSASILEVGSNDGYLLSTLQAKGFRCLGLEPSRILVEHSRQLGVDVHQGYLDEKNVSEIIDSHGNFDCIVGNNVFAHIPDLAMAIRQVQVLLKDGGLFVIEIAHAVEIVRKGIFDTIYHEHHSYHTILALRPFLESLGFGLIAVEEVPTHGGSLRIVAQKGSISKTEDVSRFEKIEKELGFDEPEVFQAMKNRIEQSQSDFSKALEEAGDSVIFGYTAPAKVVTFLYQVCENPENIQFIIDDNLMKQGKFLPGLGVPVVGASHLKNILKEASGRKMTCFVFAWNLSDELRSKIKLMLPDGSEIVSFFPTLTKEIIT